MKTIITKSFSRKIIVFAAIATVGLVAVKPAYSQVGYGFGETIKGLSVSAGAGMSQIITHYDSNPFVSSFVASADYNFNPYLTIGFQGQIGTLQGIDSHKPAHLYYTSSTNSYKSINVNLRAGVGLFWNFRTHNAFQDALKRGYVGMGYGIINNNISFTYDPALAQFAYLTPKTTGNYPTIPFNFGTYINLFNVLGYDRLELNPNFQFSYVPSMYTDGFISSPYSHLKGFYNLTSISLKYKFKTLSFRKH